MIQIKLYMSMKDVDTKEIDANTKKGDFPILFIQKHGFFKSKYMGIFYGGQIPSTQKVVKSIGHIINSLEEETLGYKTKQFLMFRLHLWRLIPIYNRLTKTHPFLGALPSSPKETRKVVAPN